MNWLIPTAISMPWDVRPQAVRRKAEKPHKPLVYTSRPQSVIRADRMKQALQYLSKHKEARTLDVSTALGCDVHYTRKLLKDMSDAGKVTYYKTIPAGIGMGGVNSVWSLR